MKVIVYKGYKVPESIPGIGSIMPKGLRGERYYKKKKLKERCGSRSGIEELISHIKQDQRMRKTYLSDTAGDQINSLSATAAYNMRKWMRLKK